MAGAVSCIQLLPCPCPAGLALGRHRGVSYNGRVVNAAYARRSWAMSSNEGPVDQHMPGLAERLVEPSWLHDGGVGISMHGCRGFQLVLDS